MGTCPECNETLNYLNNYQRGEAQYRARLNLDGTGLEYGWEGEFIADEEAGDFECPFCTKVITTNASEAEAFLRGLAPAQS
jgi:hypothetical protein